MEQKKKLREELNKSMSVEGKECHCFGHPTLVLHFIGCNCIYSLTILINLWTRCRITSQNIYHSFLSTDTTWLTELLQQFVFGPDSSICNILCLQGIWSLILSPWWINWSHLGTGVGCYIYSWYHWNREFISGPNHHHIWASCEDSFFGYSDFYWESTHEMVIWTARPMESLCRICQATLQQSNWTNWMKNFC